MTQRDQMKDALKGHGADYVEIRLEESDSTRIQYLARELEEIGRNSGRGGSVRAAFNGGWGFVSFNDTDDLKSRVRLAVEQAKAVGGDKTELAETDPSVADVPAVLVNDPNAVSLSDKKDRMDHYNDLIWSTPGIQSSSVIYGDNRRRVHFVNSEGASVDQEFVHVICYVSAVARDGGDVQQASFSIGSLGDYGLIDGLDDEIRAVGQRAVDLLSAPGIEGGERTVILDPVLAGVFAHEAFGHLSEADHVYENEQLKEIMVLGRKFGQPHLNIVDGAAIPNLRGSMAYDDEGTPTNRTDLIRDGVLVGRLHSRETAAKMGEKPSGNARAINYNHPPIVRMTNTVIEPGDASLEDLLEGVDDGVYVRNWYGGMTSMEMFTFSSGEAYRIRKGRIEEMVRPVMLSGNVFKTLNQIDGIGNDLGMNQGGGCGKAGQSPLPVSNGSPHIRIQNCLVSGA
ncbi:MAG: TldD/PmbA family protein [Chloroflexi bacterium]|nr:TldD/PmbA family protein [Chloroflexota bacterium]